MSDDRENFVVWGLVALGYHEVLRGLVARMPPTQASLDTLDAVIADVLRDGQNTEVPGLGIEEEARVLRKAFGEIGEGLETVRAELRKRMEGAAGDDAGGP